MIFVTVGNCLYSFDRLLRKMDEIAGEIDEPVVIQRGHSLYQPQNAKYFDYVPFDEALDYFRRASIVVGHVASGTIINAHKFHKPLIAAPRHPHLNEDIDDHQLETARAIVGRPGIFVVFDLDELKDVISKILSSHEQLQHNATVNKNRSRVISVIREFIIAAEENR
jgi:UDP-N-acetylglucosamine transferase subunit ALG13